MEAHDISVYRKDFPILNTQVNGNPLTYLDNAATTQVPEPVLACLCDHYRYGHANVYRGAHALSRKATAAVEAVRRQVCRFLDPDGSGDHEVVFTSGTTDSLNMIAAGLRDFVGPGQEIIVSALEHHSNFVPWQQLCRETGAILRVVPLNADGSGFDMAAYERLLGPSVRVVAVTQVSNLTGEKLPVADIARLAHEQGALVVVDGAQGVREFDFAHSALCGDFYCFSAHKLFGPTGVGLLFGKRHCLEMLRPARFGGGMVASVTKQETVFAQLPHCLEAGTPNIAGITAFGTALSYLEHVGMTHIRDREARLMAYLYDGLASLPDINIVGGNKVFDPSHYSHILSFDFPDVDAYDLAGYLDHLGIAVRQGSHCAQPAMDAYGVRSALRVSPAFYNTFEELDRLVHGLIKARVYFWRWRP